MKTLIRLGLHWVFTGSFCWFCHAVAHIVSLVSPVVSSSSINCENCKATHPVTSLAQCCDGHLLCKACLEKATKLILVGNQSVSLNVLCDVIFG